jgi:hypothetical protein
MAAYFLGRWNNTRTLSAKYRDRLYELNKLTVQSGDVALAFFDPSNHTGHYFDQLDNIQSAVPAGGKHPAELVLRVRAYAHYRLNFYEEIFFATRGWTFRVFEDTNTWRSFVKTEVGSQPLVRELLKRDKNKYGAAFVAFTGI